MPTPIKGTTILTRFSVNNGAPGTNVLSRGEQAYSFKLDTTTGGSAGITNGGQRLYIGALDGADIVPVIVGGQYYTDMMNQAHGTLTASSAIIVNSDSWVDSIKTGGLQLGTTGNSNQIVTTIITSGLDTDSLDSELPTAKAVFDAITDGSNIFLDNLGDVQILGSGGPTDGQVLIYNNASGVQQWQNQTLDGDATIDNLGEITLATVLGTAAGEYGSNGAIPVITVNEKGLITAIHTVSVSTEITINGDGPSTASLDILNNGLTFSGGDGITTEVTIDSAGEVDVNIHIDDTVATDADKLDFFSATTSAELASVISDETGYSVDNSGAKLVFNNSPTINDAIVAGTATVAVFNDTATTVNAFGAATEINIGAATGDTTVNNNLIVAGNLTVSGTTTQVNTVVTSLTDPVIQLATNAIAGGDANDRGVSFNFGEGGVVKTGFFGMDMQSKRFVFQKAVGSGSGSGGTGSTGNEFFSPWGDAEFNGLYAVVSEIGDIKLGGAGTLGKLTTTAGDLTIASFSGEVVFGVPGSGGTNANVTVTGDLDVSGTVTLADPLTVTSGGTGVDVLTSNAFAITTEGSTGVAPALDFITYTSVNGSVGVMQIGSNGQPTVSDIIDGGEY
jgi:hypothetical protein